MDRNIPPDERRQKIDPLATPDELQPQDTLPEEGRYQRTEDTAEQRSTDAHSQPREGERFGLPGDQQRQFDPYSRQDMTTQGGYSQSAQQVQGQPSRSDQAPLLSAQETGDLRVQWDVIQTGFVDEPRKAVKDADHLVALALERLTSTFQAERGRLEEQWDRGGDVSTEDMRLALQRYRAFFHRLLAI